MSLMRRCSRTACGRRAVATLTYVYADQTAVLGPLATFAEPHTYDLCAEHAERLTAPQGWDVVRLVHSFADIPDEQDDLLAVADALRDRAVRDSAARRTGSSSERGSEHDGRSRGGGDGATHEARRRPEATGTAGFHEMPGAMGHPRSGHLRVLRDDRPRPTDR